MERRKKENGCKKDAARKIRMDTDKRLEKAEDGAKILAFAREELQRGLETAFDVDGETLEVSFGLPDRELRFDGYEIRCEGNRLLILSGEPRGILHGCYETLRMLGFDYTFPGRERQRIPKKKIHAFPEKERIREPWLEFRGLCIYHTTRAMWKETLDAVDWMAKNGFNFLLTSIHRRDDTGLGNHAILWDEIGEDMIAETRKRGIVLDMSEHSTDYYFPPEEKFREHPEWFALQNNERRPGQLCYSNPEAVEAYGNSLAEFVKKQEGFRFFGIWPLDGGDYCECEKCRDPLTIYRACRKIAGKIAAVRPDLTVEHLAYTPQSFGRPKEKLPKNMSVLVCSVRDRIAYEWAQLAADGGGTFYFDYNTADHYRWCAQLWLNPRYEREMVSTMVSYGFRGVVSLYLPVECWWQAGINCWYLRRFYYEPASDLRALTRELAGILFGEKVACQMEEILMRVYDELQARELWSRKPHTFDSFREHISGRNRELDRAHREEYERVSEAVMDMLKDVQAEKDGNNLEFLKAYLELQRRYLIAVDQYDVQNDTPEKAEWYFEKLKELEEGTDNPFISAEYARWRIAGRDSLLVPEKENAYVAAEE